MAARLNLLVVSNFKYTFSPACLPLDVSVRWYEIFLHTSLFCQFPMRGYPCWWRWPVSLAIHLLELLELSTLTLPSRPLLARAHSKEELAPLSTCRPSADDGDLGPVIGATPEQTLIVAGRTFGPLGGVW